MKLIVQNALRLYSQDRTGQVDYALESGGKKEASQCYQCLSILGLLYKSVVNPVRISKLAASQFSTLMYVSYVMRLQALARLKANRVLTGKAVAPLLCLLLISLLM